MPAVLRRRRERLVLALVGLGLLAPAHPVRAGEESRERVGPLLVSSSGRDSVRGGRPDGATIHETHAPGAHDPESGPREDLANFERQTFPIGTRPTIVASPPEPWMAALTLPDLPVRWNQQTVAYLKYFRDDPRGQALIKGWIRRMNRYEHILRPILKEVGVPEDLVFVAMAESGFNPKVRSRVGAAGMWQFMEGTGRVYGLDRDYWVDERHDLERSTYAAATYLKDLRVRFGSWEMALAAFNAGYGLVMTSVSRGNTNNFWALCQQESGLPHATTMYVPKIIAAALVGRNRAVFHVGPDLSGSLPAIQLTTVEAPPATALASVAKAIGDDPALIEELNAHLIRKRTPPGKRTALRIPKQKLALYQQGASKLGGDGANQHSVRYGETLAEIAQKYATTEAALRRLNELDDTAELERDTVLLVPTTKSKTPPAPRTRPRAAVPLVTVDAGSRLVFFEVTRATSPRGLGEAFGVAWDSVVGWNDLDPQARLQPGQILQIVVPRSFDAQAARVDMFEADQVDRVLRGSREHIEGGLRDRGLVRRGYRVRKGDDLTKIGKKFDLSDGDLGRINGFSRDHVPPPGSTIVVYVAKGRERGTVDAPPPVRGESSAAAEPSPEAEHPSGPTDMDAEPGPGVVREDLEGAASTETSTKLPGQQGWTRKPSTLGKPGKSEGKSEGKARSKSKGKASKSVRDDRVDGGSP